MSLSASLKKLIFPVVIIGTVCCANSFAAAASLGSATVRVSGLGTIKGVIRDQSGSGIADATVAIFRVGTSTLLKQVKSASDGSFLAKIIPGTYTVLAVAEGFNPVTLASVDVARSAELVYGFKLVRAGSGNTLAEKARDRNSTKWAVRATNAQRTIFQNVEGKSPVNDDDVNSDSTASLEVAGRDTESTARKGQTAVETYFASSAAGNYAGLNFATLLPISAKAQIVLAGQASSSKAGPSRFETQFNYRANSKHQLRASTSIGRLGTISRGAKTSQLGQVSAQALDEWTVREGVIFVVGVDYSQFLGASKDSAVSPRLGLQFDVNPKTRFHAAYTTQTQQRSWSDVIDLEDSQVAFQEPVAVEDLVTVNDRPQLNKSRRFEIGIERVLDNKSSIETTAFFDLTTGRGVGLTNIPLDTLEGTGFGDMVANQQGKAQGVRVVYNRRISSILSAGAGYAFGNGQKISQDALSDPSHIFENGLFQSVFGQLSADFSSTGTNIRTIYRLSPQATVFAIDPFQGRLAIYDPSLSVMVTQALPTLGLPIRAQAILDARNLFGFQTGISTEDGILRLNGQQPTLRGGILVRF
jgi:hypothetical protein